MTLSIQQFSTAALTVVLGLGLSACSGSSSKNKLPTAQLTLGGKAVSIDGLGYKSASVSGVTRGGKFNYKQGESVEFMLGDTVLGNLTDPTNAKLENVLQGSYQLPTDEISFKQALNNTIDMPELAPLGKLDGIHLLSNKVKLLLLLDADREPSNGLDLADWHAKLAGSQLDLNTSLYDSSNFLALFQNASKPAQFAPSLIDLAAPLSYYTEAVAGQISVSKLDELTVVNPTSAITTVHTFTFDAFGRITKSVADKRRNSDLDQPFSEDTYEYQYDNFGQTKETLTIQKRSLDQDTPDAPYVSKETRTHTGYYNNRQNGPLYSKYVNRTGDSLDNLTFSSDETSISADTIPFQIVGYSNSNVERSGKHYRYDYVYKYDALGRVTDSSGANKYYEADDTLIHDHAVDHETYSYQKISSQQQIKEEVVDDAEDGVIDGSPDYKRITTRNTDSNNRLSVCTSLTKNPDESIRSGSEHRYSYADEISKLPTSLTGFSDSNKDGVITENEKSSSKSKEYNQQGQLIKSSTLDSNNNRHEYLLAYVQTSDDSVNLGRLKSITRSRNYDQNGTPKYIDTYAYSYNQQKQLTTITESTTESGVDLPANKRTTVLEYDNTELVSYNTTYSNDKVSEATLVTSSMANGVGYLIHRQTAKIFEDKVYGEADYRQRAKLPATIVISNRCRF